MHKAYPWTPAVHGMKHVRGNRFIGQSRLDFKLSLNHNLYYVLLYNVYSITYQPKKHLILKHKIFLLDFTIPSIVYLSFFDNSHLSFSKRLIQVAPRHAVLERPCEPDEAVIARIGRNPAIHFPVLNPPLFEMPQS